MNNKIARQIRNSVPVLNAGGWRDAQYDTTPNVAAMAGPLGSDGKPTQIPVITQVKTLKVGCGAQVYKTIKKAYKYHARKNGY